MRILFGAALAICAAFSVPSFATAQQADGQAGSPTAVDDVVVLGKTPRQTIEAFVDAVGAAAPGRKLAVWHDRICVGVIGMQADAARLMADRILDWSAELGVRTGDSGCRPNVLIVAAEDGNAMARELVATQSRAFRPGYGGATLGPAALRAFQTSGNSVRWWHTSMPVNSDTGRPVVRPRDQEPFASPAGGITRPADLGPFGMITTASRISDNTRDDLRSIFVVVENRALDRANFQQLTDYVAMIVLAQVDPQTSPPLPSILHLFEKNSAFAQAPSLTSWDTAYLRALYATYQGRASSGANSTAIALAMASSPVPRDTTAEDVHP